MEQSQSQVAKGTPVRRAVVPAGYQAALLECRAKAAAVEGFLKPKEVDLLFLLGAVPTAAGTILEIGSYRGRSAVILALGSRLSDRAKVHACDPLPEDQTVGGRTGLQMIDANLEAAGVKDEVEVHAVTSGRLSQRWSQPLRLLWIDGDHSFDAARLDLSYFIGHLSPGAIVAMHDCLQPSPGPLKAFIEQVVLDPRFGRVGVCGSIGWGQYLGPRTEFSHLDERLALYRKLARVLPYHLDPRPQGFFTRKLYLLWRALVPHGAVDPQTWAGSLATP